MLWSGARCSTRRLRLLCGIGRECFFLLSARPLFHAVGSIDAGTADLKATMNLFTNSKGMRVLNCIVVCLQGRVLLYKAFSAAAVHRVKPASKETLLKPCSGWRFLLLFFPFLFFLFVFFPEERRQGEEAKRARGRPWLPTPLVDFCVSIQDQRHNIDHGSRGGSPSGTGFLNLLLHLALDHPLEFGTVGLIGGPLAPWTSIGA